MSLVCPVKHQHRLLLPDAKRDHAARCVPRHRDSQFDSFVESICVSIQKGESFNSAFQMIQSESSENFSSRFRSVQRESFSVSDGCAPPMNFFSTINLTKPR